MNATSGWIRWLVMAILLGHVAMAAAQAPANRNKGRAAADAVSVNRIALVIGNASYRAIPLSNPVNDARLVSGNLRKLGFQVEEHLNLNVRDFRRVLRDFARKMNSDGDGVALFYYAGHGMQIDGRNYLLPVDLNLRDEEEVKDDAVDIEDIFIRRVDRPDGKARVVILDACRDNPFGARTRNIRASSGLAEMAARGTLIAYASAPGAPAEDGPTGTNSIYTRHLAEEMIKPGLEIEQMFKNVRVKVLRDTNQRQIPWVNTSLTVNFSFNPAPADPAQPDAARLAQVDRLEAELEQITADCALVDALLLALEGKLQDLCRSCTQSMRLDEMSCREEADALLSMLRLTVNMRTSLSFFEQRIGKISNAAHQD